jgi:hypothetical protein
MSAESKASEKKSGRILSYIIILGAFAIIGAQIAVTQNKNVADIGKATLVSSVTNKQETVKLPLTRPGQEREKLDLKFPVTFEEGQPTAFLLVPDDCLKLFEINGKEVKMTDAQKSKQCNWAEGIVFDLKDYLKEGKNDFHIIIENGGGVTGLRFSPI